MAIKGEGIPRIVKILKVRKDVPTKIEVDGREYALVHPDKRK